MFLGLADRLYALDCLTGDSTWVFSIGTGTRNNAPVVTSSGVIYFASGDSLYAIEANSGQFLWKHNWGQTHSIVFLRYLMEHSTR